MNLSEKVKIELSKKIIIKKVDFKLCKWYYNKDNVAL